MEKGEVKKLVKKHWKEILVGAGAASLGFVIGKNICSKPNNLIDLSDIDDKKFIEFCEDVLKIRKGTNGYIPVDPDEFTELATHELLKGVNGVVIKPVGAIAFGDIIE